MNHSAKRHAPYIDDLTLDLSIDALQDPSEREDSNEEEESK